MKDFKLTISSLGYLVAEITKLITSNQNKVYRVSIKEWRESRSLSQNAFQHVIYDELSKYLISKGRKDWSKEKVKFEMKNNFLGWVEIDCTDVRTGEITKREVLKETSKLDVGESFFYTTQILDFAQSIGCLIKIPEACEYRELLERQQQ